MLPRVLVSVIAGLASVAGSVGCDRSESKATGAQPWFQDVAEASGLQFVQDVGPVETYFMPKIMGSGGGVFDADGDGRLDVYIVHNAGQETSSVNQLFLQTTPGKFVNASEGSGTDLPGYWMGIAAGDLNNDARNDLIVVGYADMRVLMNMGDGTFHDVSETIGERLLIWGASATLLDYDRDGLMDIAVADYVQYEASKACVGDDGKLDYCTPTGLSLVQNRLYHNESPPEAKDDPTKARFRDVTAESGIGQFAGVGLGVLAQDFNDDGWVDILFANDGRPNHLWINQHDGTFAEEAVARGIATDVLGAAEANMGIAVGDARNAGTFDIYISHLPDEGNTYWMQSSPGLFEDRTGQLGLNNLKWRASSFGVVMRDFDNDGWSDLAMIGGRIRRPTAAVAKTLPQTFWGQFSEQNQLLKNENGTRFIDISEEHPELCGYLNVGRGLASWDFDDDGGVDLLAIQIAGPVKLLRNVAPRGNWLTVRTIDPSVGGRDAYGTTVLAKYAGGQHLAIANPGFSYMVTCDPRAHIGLGTATQVDELIATWPDGTREKFGPIQANQVITLAKGTGSPVSATSAVTP